MVYITSTLTGKSIRDGHFVILWFEIDNSEGARGSKEAYSCKMQYFSDPSRFNRDSISIETYDGQKIDFTKVQGSNSEWFKE